MADSNNRRLGEINEAHDKIAEILLNTFSKHRLFQGLDDKWPICLIAMDLLTNFKRAKQTKSDLMTNRSSLQEALATIIEEWMGNNDGSSSESLQKLCSTLSSYGFDKYTAEIQNLAFPDTSSTKRLRRNHSRNTDSANFPSTSPSSGTYEAHRRIAQILLTTSSKYNLFQELEDKWLICLIAMDLLTNFKMAKQLKSDLMSNRLSPQDALATIIKEWMENNGSGSESLQKLISTLSSYGFDKYTAEIQKLMFSESSSTKRQKRNLSSNTENETASSSSTSNNNNSANLRSTYYLRKYNSTAKALQNTVILDNIFEKLRVTDQKQFRLVNKLWEKNSVQRWRRSVQIYIDVVTNRRRDYRPKGCLGNFLEFWENLEVEGHPHPLKNIPFRNFKLSGNRNVGEMKLQGGVKGASLLMSQFWDLCSPKMESLSLNGIHCKGGFLSTMKWILLESDAAGVCRRVQLKELIIEGCSFNSRSNGAPRLVDEQSTEIAKNLTSLKLGTINHNQLEVPEIAGLLQLIPNLKTLFITEDVRHEVAQALALSSEVYKKNKKNPIQLEVLETWLHSDNIFHLKEYMKAAKPKFKKLHLKFYVCMETSLFNQFILNPSSSSMLTKLEIRLDLVDRYWITDFTGYSFPQLNEFRLGIHDIKNSTEQNGGKFDFKAFYGMPNLKSFECKQYAGSTDADVGRLRMDELMSEGKDKWMGEQEVEVQQNGSPVHLQLDKLEEFEFSLSRNFDKESLAEVASWMKNLKKLSLVFKTKNTFRAALKLWPDLEEVTVLTGSKVSKTFIEEERGNRSMKVYLHVGKGFYDPGTLINV